jgi:hypothetical protein
MLSDNPDRPAQLRSPGGGDPQLLTDPLESLWRRPSRWRLDWTCAEPGPNAATICMVMREANQRPMSDWKP